MMVRILVAARDVAARRRLSRLLGSTGGVAVLLPRGIDLHARLARSDFDLVLVDDRDLPDRPEGFIGPIRQLPERPDVLVVTAVDDPARRAQLLGAGCLDVVSSSWPDEALREVLHALLERRRELDRQRYRADEDSGRSLADFVSDSPAMKVFLQVARRVTTTDSALLILGETGVGKERLARAIHAGGRRSAGPFLAVNCGALSETLLESDLFGHEEGAFTGASRARRGYFELAHGGTLFLDEIGEVPPHLQVKLLRVLEDRRILRVGGEKPVTVDVRLMAATNRDLEAEMTAKRFRADLYYRLAVVTLQIPPLRERPEDIPALVRSYLDYFRGKMPSTVQAVSPAAMDALTAYHWPGNVRELINTMERAVLLASGPLLDLADLPHRIRGGAEASGGESEGAGALDADLLRRPLLEARGLLLDGFEKRYLSSLLEATGGRVGEAAGRAGISDRALYGMMRKYGLRKERFRRGGSTPPAGSR